jgi:stage II sporulation protein R
MKRWVKALAGGVALCLILAVCGFDGECQEIRDKVVRLHILANSDSVEDQTLKLKVRDAVLQATVGWETMGEQEILQNVQEDLPRLLEVAQNTVYENGYSYPVTAKVCRMYFETRQYDEITMPAGMYDAVRFEIGEGKGKNWWCVIYPPMCLKAAEKGDTLAQVLTDRQMSIVTGEKGYQVRFKLLEVAQWLISRFR